MSSSLVADYGSDSESGEEVDSKIYSTNDSSKKEQNFLVNEEEITTLEDEQPAMTPNSDQVEIGGKLPLPSFLDGDSNIGSGNAIDSSTHSVFMNPFEEARKKELAVLEQHVKLKEESKMLPKTKVCYKFQKGLCNKGALCRFFHDRQTSVANENSNKEFDQDQQNPGIHRLHSSEGISNQRRVYHYQPSSSEVYNAFGVEEDDSNAHRKRKMRAGLSEGLNPSKKAQLIYDKQRRDERPWTERR